MNWVHSWWIQLEPWWSNRFRPPDSSSALDVSLVASRLSVFLKAGLSPSRAWEEVARTSDDDVVRAVSSELERTRRHRESVESVVKGRSPAWVSLACVVAIADEAGAPLADVLWRFSESLRLHHTVERERAIVTTAPRLTVGILLVLPLIGLAMASAVGVNAVEFLLATTLGRVSGVGALLLLGVALIWMRRMISRAIPTPGDRGLPTELFSIATSGGVLPEEALSRVRRVLSTHGLPDDHDALVSLAEISRRVGVGVSALAIAEATWVRQRVRLDAEEAHAVLSVALLVPLGVLILPAFVLVAVVPVVVTLLGDVLAASTIPW